MRNVYIGVIAALITLLLIVIDTEETNINDLEFELNNTRSKLDKVYNELNSVNDSIANGLCLPKLDLDKKSYKLGV